MIRLRELRVEKGLSLRDLADILDLSYSSIGKYERNEAQPSFDVLFKIADFFDVTIDYLIGYSDARTKNLEDKAIAEKLGLSLRSIDILSGYQMNAKRHPKDSFDTTPATANIFLATLNDILDSDVLENMAYYLYLQFDFFYDDDTYSDEDFYKHISELGLFDKRLGISYSDDYDYLSQAFLLMVQKDLMTMREKNLLAQQKRITPIAEEYSIVYYSSEPEQFMQHVNKQAGFFFGSYLQKALRTKARIHYADNLKILEDSSISMHTLTLFFADDTNESISLDDYEIRPSRSVEHEFYVQSKLFSDDYFVINFDKT